MRSATKMKNATTHPLTLAQVNRAIGVGIFGGILFVVIVCVLF